MAQTAAAARGTAENGHTDQHFWALTLGSLGVVFGDIGTSPLYALREAVKASSGGPDAVPGILSLMVWTMLLIVTLKYVLVLLNADNKGEGGTFALMALGQSVAKRSASLLLVLGVIGAAFFYGDAVLTPAISVLSAVEGLKLVAPQLEHVVLPLTLVILVLLFVVQSHGTAKVAQYFGPVMLVWFAVLADRRHRPHRRRSARLPRPQSDLGVQFVLTHGIVGLVVMGLVFLAVTGAEALYADLGHFGRKPIQMAWFAVGAAGADRSTTSGRARLLLAHPEAIDNPFYRLYPSWALIPMVMLATIATVIASQAVITGAFSLDAAGGPARAAAAPGHPPHVGKRGRPDLSAARQPAAVRRRGDRDA